MYQNSLHWTYFVGNTYNRVYIWCCKYGENRYCERCANKKWCTSKHAGLLNSCLGKLCLHPYLVVPLISARVTLISTRVSAHCHSILLLATERPITHPADPGKQSMHQFLMVFEEMDVWGWKSWNKYHTSWETHYNTACLITYSSVRSARGALKNRYELLNLRALKFSYANKIDIFQCVGKLFCVEFQRHPLKFHTQYPTHTLRDVYFIRITCENLRGLRFKSSYVFLKCYYVTGES